MYLIINFSAKQIIYKESINLTKKKKMLRNINVRTKGYIYIETNK